MHKNLRSFIDTLKKEKDLAVITTEVDPYLEIPEIHRRVIAEGGPALLFTHPKNSRFPIITNLFGAKRRVEIAFGSRPEQLIQQLVQLIHQMVPPKMGTLWKHRDQLKEFTKMGLKSIPRRKAPVLEVEEQDFNINDLPVLTTWHEDGGAFFTLPLVYTEHPKTKEHNLGNVSDASLRLQPNGDALADSQRWRVPSLRSGEDGRSATCYRLSRWSSCLDHECNCSFTRKRTRASLCLVCDGR